MNKIKFAVLDVNEGLKVIEANRVNWTTLCSYLHEDYLDYEHPTNISGVWMLEDDGYEYVEDNEDTYNKYLNKYSFPFFDNLSGAIGNCILFRPGKMFGYDGDFDDIESLTEEDIEKIEGKVNAIKANK